MVIERDGAVVGFARTGPCRPRECHAGVAEVSVYVAREHRCEGVSRQATQAIIDAAEAAGFWKLVCGSSRRPAPAAPFSAPRWLP